MQDNPLFYPSIESCSGFEDNVEVSTVVPIMSVSNDVQHQEEIPDEDRLKFTFFARVLHDVKNKLSVVKMNFESHLASVDSYQREIFSVPMRQLNYLCDCLNANLKSLPFAELDPVQVRLATVRMKMLLVELEPRIYEIKDMVKDNLNCFEEDLRDDIVNAYRDTVSLFDGTKKFNSVYKRMGKKQEHVSDILNYLSNYIPIIGKSYVSIRGSSKFRLLFVNKRHLMSLINELIVNASKSVQKTGREANIRALVEIDEHNFLSISIKDNGEGVNGKSLPELISNRDDSSEQSNGLGLEDIIDTCRANSWAFSAKDLSDQDGAVFTVTIPLLGATTDPQQRYEKFLSEVESVPSSIWGRQA